MSLQVWPLSSLPVGIKNGVGGLVGRRIYAGLGSAGKRLFYYDLEQPAMGWQEAPSFPGLERNDAVAITTENRLYVFSGAGIERGNTYPTVLTDGYYFDVEDNCWSRLNSQNPVGLLGASGCEISPGQLVFFGGYNKQTFDGFLKAISGIDATSEPSAHKQLLSTFMSKPIKDYEWNSNIWQFDVASQTWSIIANNPFPANCGAGLVKQGCTVTLIEGEVKPGLRSLDTKQFTFQPGDKVSCHRAFSIVESKHTHEGIAGGFAGHIKGQLTIAGGAYFPGSQDNYKNGQWYSHQGQEKHYSTDIWSCAGKQWQVVGQLEKGIAYGIAISVADEMYVIGGEDKSGAAQSNCYVLTGA